MARHPTYILAPNLQFKAETGPIALGNLIADPFRPHRALTSISPTALQQNYPRIESVTDHEFSKFSTSSHDVSMSVWAHFVHAVSAKISRNHGSTQRTEYTMEALETNYMAEDPSPEEIRARVAVPRVQSFMKAGSIPGFRQPVYMVTGVKIANGLRALEEWGNNGASEVDIGSDAPTPAGQVAGGVSTARSSSAEASDRWRAADNIVFAYQLLKIEIKGWKGARLEYDELRHRAAFLNNDSEDDDELNGANGGVLQVSTSAARTNNLPRLSNIDHFTSVSLGEGDDQITCISAVDS
ncbi:hypothetical protein N8T08_007438 [Aspergillus melleus]|uniref:Uncharacterized protein n=1 Tax=Aspergillus melleus TaxID=138277 RepID=A0ACC3AXY2_9EURO|nr:hypothetical protein N8T08_007438 [Aspergillus melleus]